MILQVGLFYVSVTSDINIFTPILTGNHNFLSFWNLCFSDVFSLVFPAIPIFPCKSESPKLHSRLHTPAFLCGF